MHWQDWVFSSGALVFIVALVPSIQSKDKPALFTSLSTSLVLFVFATTYLTLSLWFSAATTAVTGLMWLTLGIQKYTQKKHLGTSQPSE